MSGARNAIIQATALHHRSAEWLGIGSGTAGRRGNLGAIARGLEAGEILSAMDRNPPHVRDWLWFAYGASYTPQQFQHLADQLWAMYLATRAPQGGRRVLHALVAFVLDEQRQVLLGGKAKYTHEGLAHALGVPRGSWTKLWEPERGAMKDIVDGWDRAGLAPVARVLRRRQEAYISSSNSIA